MPKGVSIHDEYEGGVSGLSAGREDEPPEREESDERHVVCHDHGAEVCNEDQRKADATHIAEGGDDLACQPFEEAPLLEGADDCQSTEEAREGVEVEVIGVGGIRGHEDASHRCREDCDDEYGVTFECRRDVMQGTIPRVSADHGAHTEDYLYAFREKKASIFDMLN